MIVWKTTPVGEGQSQSLHRRPLPRFMTSSGQGARVFAHGAMGRRIDPSWWTHWAISRSKEWDIARGKSVRSWWDGSSDRSFMVDPLSYFSFQPVLHNWCNKGRGMCYPICGMMHIKETWLFIGKSSLYGDSGFPFSLSEWSLTICLTPYNRK